MKGYDSHLIIKGLKNQFKEINCIPLNAEKYLTITLDNFKFIDSFSFLSISLEKLVETTLKDAKSIPHTFKHTHQLCESISKSYPVDKAYLAYFTMMGMLCRKGVYPYDYMDSLQRFNETEFPSQSDFYSQLSKSEISTDDHEFGAKVYKTFKCNNLGDYHDLYLKTDITLLADVFNNFRTLSLKSYKLDPIYYVSLPSFAWDAMLNMTKVEITLLNDQQIEIYQMIEESMRGGISMISNRFSKANQPNLSGYDINKQLTELIYLDANNLYGWAMSQYLPLNDFKMTENFDHFTPAVIQSLSDTDSTGFIFEVDLKYGDVNLQSGIDLHNLHNDYPVAVEHIIPTKDMWSTYSIDHASRINHKESKVAKLIPNLNDKTKYVVHYRNLKLYLQLGLEITK
ncbi:MAG: hypothetical protein P4L31_01035, partial [Candidatus Babeliales bacterium]|nr:hypothetical protein [Candidatus Babeliales bacterium]